MKLSSGCWPRKVLFIGAHADDIELMAGGAVAKTEEAYCLTFSAHKGVTDAEKAAQEHGVSMSKVLDVETFCLLSFPAVSSGPDSMQAGRKFIYDRILSQVTDIEPAIVVTHNQWDTNQDHRFIRDEVIRACKGRVSVISGEYPFNTVNAPDPTLFVELSEDDLNAKIKAIQTYQSQYAPHRHYFREDVWRGLAALRGAQIGTTYAEAFHIERMIF